MVKNDNYFSWFCKRFTLLGLIALVLVIGLSILAPKNVSYNSSHFNHFEAPRDETLRTSNSDAKTPKSLSISSMIPDLHKRPRKFFLDCGANTGSTYKLFHEIWPNPEEYYMISFEIDPILAPYYAGFVNHTAMVPLGVSFEEGNFEAYLEPAWQPEKTSASKWGGGSLFTFSKEGKNEWRGLKRLVNVPTFDLSQFILDNFHEDDEVVLKIDIEGAEYRVIDQMLKKGAFKMVDTFFLEFHDWQPTGWNKTQKDNLRKRMKLAGVGFKKWEAEYPTVPGAEKWHPALFGALQKPKSKTCRHSEEGTIKVVVAVGMNERKSSRVIQSVLAHNLTLKLNIGVFLYRDFIFEHPKIVLEWTQNPRIVLGIRGDSPRPVEYFKKLTYKNEINMMIISSMRQLVRTTGRSTEWYLPDVEGNQSLESQVAALHLKSLSNTVWVPPKDPSTLAAEFFSKRSVEKIPPVLNVTQNTLQEKVGNKTYLVLDTDFDETWISSVFLLDYLASPHAKEKKLVLESFITC